MNQSIQSVSDCNTCHTELIYFCDKCGFGECLPCGKGEVMRCILCMLLLCKRCSPKRLDKLQFLCICYDCNKFMTDKNKQDYLNL